MNYLRTITICLLALCPVVYADSVVLPADPVGASASPAPTPWMEVLNRYLAASQEQQSRLRDSTMEVDIEAKLPRLKKEGSLHALRQVTQLGQITYQAMRSAGDKMVRKDVIARYLSADTEASNGSVTLNGKIESIVISPENYKFKYKGLSADASGRRVHVFQINPKKKQVGLFKGELWVDAETYLPLRESGRLVRNPSVFLKKVEFVRDYEIQDGLALPSKLESRVDTRVVGMAELTIRFSNYSIQQTAQARICALGW